MTDPVVDEMSRIREERAAEPNFDLGAIFADLKSLEAGAQSEARFLPPVEC